MTKRTEPEIIELNAEELQQVLQYVESAPEDKRREVLKAIIESYVYLTSLVGKNVQFILVVKAEGSYKDDKALWVKPRIVR